MVHSDTPPDPNATPGWWEHLGDTEPVRRALWPVAVAVVALLVGYGVLTEHLAALWIGVAAAVLIPGAAEVARSAAWAPGSVDERDLDWLEHLDAWRDYEYERGLADAATILDAPGEHAAPEPPGQPRAIVQPATAHPRTREIPAVRSMPPRME